MSGYMIFESLTRSENHAESVMLVDINGTVEFQMSRYHKMCGKSCIITTEAIPQPAKP